MCKSYFLLQLGEILPRKKTLILRTLCAKPNSVYVCRPEPIHMFLKIKIKIKGLTRG
jgi:hypothetical protein